MKHYLAPKLSRLLHYFSHGRLAPHTALSKSRLIAVGPLWGR